MVGCEGEGRGEVGGRFSELRKNYKIERRDQKVEKKRLAAERACLTLSSDHDDDKHDPPNGAAGPRGVL